MFGNTPTALSLTASAANLQRLNIIRLIVLAGIAAALAYLQLQQAQDISLYTTHSIIASLYALVACATVLRLRQAWPVTDLEYFLHLLTDVSIISGLLYLSGGASNPFVSYFLVPLSISAAILPWRYTWIIAGYSLAAYSLMLFYFEPLPTTVIDHSHHGSSSFNQHILGMWFNFCLSAAVITYFVVKMANTLRQRESQWAKEREDTLRDEQILAVATLAAGTAHELGTPLSTITVLVDEIKADNANNQQLQEDIQLLQQQVNRCNHILKNLVNTAQVHSQKQQEQVLLSDYLEQLLSHWQVIRPNAQFNFTSQAGTAPTTLVDTTLEQAILNLLNNAADASPQTIAIHLSWNAHHYTLSIRDHGPGISAEIAEQMGQPFISTKGRGLGLGLFLSHATVQRYGGNIELHNHPQGGTVAELNIPYNNNEVTA
ncbi:ATP-binding protein [Dasania sp. GY-MA-18]|uniref:histidine kinase n=1 Tax=Dasania phycosphaerae TaxID=2950436 RepID=A0A9J6RHW0_9GAMM|nr:MULTISPECIES: ATP-binding protein [Dasania]MCR8921600.1 ATP-binding protein [Dasania sp. GY-MA-18]MCZ0864028.1 ATP-binding protein [Dasania phycosphaerae]MCZ0867756.1 ATP-binding protein [Dasania phycosphaerae]